MNTSQIRLRSARSDPRTELNTLSITLRILTIIACIVALSLGKEFFIPVFVSFLLSFFLAPIVQSLEKLKIPRAVAATIVTLVMFSVLVIVGGTVVSEIINIGARGSEYAEPLAEKFSILQQIVNKELRAIGVSFHVSSKDLLDLSTSMVVPRLLTIVVFAAIISVLTCITLIHREDLRNRILLMLGEHNLLASTTLLDQAATGLGRYLATNLAINIAYGTLFGLMLFMINVPSPIVWSSAVVILRFVPHLGVILSALPPALLTLAIAPGWIPAITVPICAVALDLSFTNLIEPFSYGKRVGVATLPLFIAMLFWIWLWGLPGLALATPITICLTVMGRSIPSLKVFSVIFDSECSLDRGQKLCQLLINGDTAGAQAVWNGGKEFLVQPGRRADVLLSPSLVMLTNIHIEGMHDHELGARILHGIQDIITLERRDRIGSSSCGVAVIHLSSQFGRLLATISAISLAESNLGALLIAGKKVPSSAGLADWLAMNRISVILVIAPAYKIGRLANFILLRTMRAKSKIPIVICSPGGLPDTEMERSETDSQTLWTSTFAAASKFAIAAATRAFHSSHPDSYYRAFSLKNEDVPQLQQSELSPH